MRTESEGNNEHLKCKGVSVQWDESAVIATDCKDSRATSAVIARQGTGPSTTSAKDTQK